MAKFVIKKGDLAAHAELEPQQTAQAPRFVIRRNETEAPQPPAAGAPRFVIRKGEAASPAYTATRQIRIGKAAHGAYPGIRDTVEGGRYRVDEIIGEGGSGRVCRAYDLLLDMEVAIKFLNPELIRDEESIASLKSETRICLQLVHKHIVRIFNLEKRGANFMLIMEYLKGSTLFSILSQYPQGLPLDFVAQIVAVVTDALGYAHRHGVLHKDITPGNIFITDDDIVKVIDFGIATNVGSQSRNTDTVIGTPVYMSPEQLRGEILDCRTDIYSFGVLVHQLLTGRTVNAPDATVQDMAFRPRPAIEGLPQPLADVIACATAFSPADRWETMERFGAAFASAAAEANAAPR
jgi:serine/threonine-protein kinase